MKKTIKSIESTGRTHPAVGTLYRITYTDDSVDYVYEETFFHQIPEYRKHYESEKTHYPIDQLIGKELDTTEAYYNF